MSSQALNPFLKQGRAARTNNPLHGVPNTSRGRRIADLTRAYLAALGNPVDTGEQAAVRAAAELVVLAEDARTAAVLDAASISDLDNVIRIQGAADRALRRLGLAGAARPDRDEVDDTDPARHFARPAA